MLERSRDELLDVRGAHRRSFGLNDHARRREVGQHVERRMRHRPYAADGERCRTEQHNNAVVDRPADQSIKDTAHYCSRLRM